MKQITILLICLMVGVFSESPDFFEKLESFKEDCIAESNAKSDLVEKLLEEGEFNGDRNLKCFIKCALVKMNTMNGAGEIQEAFMRSQLPSGIEEAKIDLMVEKCKDLRGGDACDTAFNVVKCSYDVVRMR